MTAMTLTEAFAEIELIDRHLELKRAFVLALAVRPANLRDPLEAVGGSAALAVQEQQALRMLADRRIAIRRAVRIVAQNTPLALGNQTRTIADWLEWRRAVASGRRKLLTDLRARIHSARQEAERWSRAIVDENAPARPLDIVVNTQESELARQSELLEEALGSLDGQLSLKSATLTIAIVSIANPLAERQTLLTAWLALLGQAAMSSPLHAPVDVTDYEIPESYNAYEGYNMPAVPFTLRTEVRRLRFDGRAIEAIKLVRDNTGWSLRDCKEAVEALV